MVHVGTGMRPGDRRGYLGQRSRCRTVYFWKLPRPDRKQLFEIAVQWNRSGPPADQKMKLAINPLAEKSLTPPSQKLQSPVSVVHSTGACDGSARFRPTHGYHCGAGGRDVQPPASVSEARCQKGGEAAERYQRVAGTFL